MSADDDLLDRAFGAVARACVVAWYYYCRTGLHRYGFVLWPAVSDVQRHWTTLKPMGWTSRAGVTCREQPPLLRPPPRPQRRHPVVASAQVKT